MKYILGIDTGGTTTNAVILDADSRKVIAEATSPTTHLDLKKCINSVLCDLPSDLLQRITRVCLSTTLATNAVLEGQMMPITLITSGRPYYSSLPHVSFHVSLDGELNIRGDELVPLDLQPLESVLDKIISTTQAVAVSVFAGVKNPAHELAIKKYLTEHSDLPVLCAHELISTLGFQKRTTAIEINAGLIPIVNNFLITIRSVLKKLNINAPVYIVKGDASLLPMDQVAERAIETILSGPAASIIGGSFLTNLKNALVVDIGGTSTDVGLVVDQEIQLNTEGTMVGSNQIAISSARVYTYATGGDSYLFMRRDGEIEIGPQRVLPLCRIAESEEAICDDLAEAVFLDTKFWNFADPASVFYIYDADSSIEYLDENSRKMWNFLTERPMGIAKLIKLMQMGGDHIARLPIVQNNIIRIAALTPTDLLVADNCLLMGNAGASKLAIKVHASKNNINGEDLLLKMKQAIQQKLFNHSINSLVRFSHPEWPQDKLIAHFFDGYFDGLHLYETKLNPEIPIIGVGAPSLAWLEGIFGLNNGNVIFPPKGNVANAVGAAVSKFIKIFKATIRPRPFGQGYSIHLPWALLLEKEYENSVEKARNLLRTRAKVEMSKYCIDYKMDLYEEVKAHQDYHAADEVFVEHRFTLRCIGVPK